MAVKKKTIAQKKIKTVMHEFKTKALKSGKSSKKVTNRKQAIAIALNSARRVGGKVKPLSKKYK